MSDTKPEIIVKKRHSAFMRYRIARRVHGAITTPPGYVDTFERFKSGLGGALPGKDGAGVIIAACDDYYYRNFAITLILSMERHGVAERMHLHLCAPSPDVVRHVELLTASLKHISLTWTTDDCRLAEGLRYRTVYYAAARFLVAASVMEATGAPILCIDVDGIAARPIWPAYESVRQNADVLVIRRPEEPKATRKILASAVGLNFTPTGRRFASGLARSLAAIMPLHPNYHVDQIAIHMLIGELSKRGALHVADMPKAFADHDFAADSVIWTTKGWVRKESDFYLAAKREISLLQPGFPALGAE
jgi:hypothetical protein